jgi:transposase
VSECIENNYDYNYIVNNYNVSYNQIYNWVRKYNKNGETALVDNRGKAKSTLTDEDKLNAKIKLLEAKNRRLQMENDFIKKLKELERMEMLKPK